MLPSASSSLDPVKRRRIAVAIQSFSLCITGAVVWAASWAPRLRWQTLGHLLSQAAGLALFACLWSAGLTFLLYRLADVEDGASRLRAPLRTCAAAVWFAPAAILLSEFSPVMILAAVLLVIATTRLLYSQWRMAEREAGTAPVTFARLPGFLEAYGVPRPFFLRQLAPGLAASLCIQGGVVAIWWHDPLFAAALFSMATAILTIFAMSLGVAEEKPPALPRSIFGVLMTILLAAGLTVGGAPGVLMRLAPSGQGWIWDLNSRGRAGLLDTARAILRQLLYGERPGAPDGGAGDLARKLHSPPNGLPGNYPGVILWPEVKPITTLVAPLPRDAISAGEAMPRPLGIPFTGEYWMFRWPYMHPPCDSYATKGSPTALGFRTPDRWPLRMEAHQKLDQPVAMRCCSKIQIEIRNADAYPGTVALELVLTDGEERGARQALGTAPALSKPGAEPAHEVLDFRMPATPVLEKFDELTVVFHLARARQDKSAKIEIDRFVLVP